MRRTRAGGADERDGQAAVGGIPGPVQVGVAPVPPPRQLPVVRMDQEPVAGPVTRAGVAEPEPQAPVLAVTGEPVRDLEADVRAGPVQRDPEPDRDRGRPRRVDPPAAHVGGLLEGVGRRELGRALQAEQGRVGSVQRRLGDVPERVENHQPVPQQHPLRLVLDRDDPVDELGGLVLEGEVRSLEAAEGRVVVAGAVEPDRGAGLPIRLAGSVGDPGSDDQAHAVGTGGEHLGEAVTSRVPRDDPGQPAGSVHQVVDLELDLHRRLVQHPVAGASEVGQLMGGGRRGVDHPVHRRAGHRAPPSTEKNRASARTRPTSASASHCGAPSRTSSAVSLIERRRYSSRLAASSGSTTIDRGTGGRRRCRAAVPGGVGAAGARVVLQRDGRVELLGEELVGRRGQLFGLQCRMA